MAIPTLDQIVARMKRGIIEDVQGLMVPVDANRFYAPIDLEAVMTRIERINERLMSPSEPS